MSLVSKAMIALTLPASLAAIALSMVPSRPVERPASPFTYQPSSANPIARGRYLVAVAGCADCHSPHNERGEEIPGRQLTGHPTNLPAPIWEPSMMEKNIAVAISPTFTAFAGPFGVSIAPNITPDKQDGIGAMTADDLVKSWRSGKHWKLDRPILPPMPASSYKNMTDQDIRAIHAYLMSLPATKSGPLPGAAGPN
jgi:mono/diheme cytochrome c family protein